jgi:hypothetical protein
MVDHRILVDDALLGAIGAAAFAIKLFAQRIDGT